MANAKVAYPLPLTLPLQIRLDSNMLELMANAKEFMANAKVAYPLPLTLPLQIRLDNNMLELMANAKGTIPCRMPWAVLAEEVLYICA